MIRQWLPGPYHHMQWYQGLTSFLTAYRISLSQSTSCLTSNQSQIRSKDLQIGLERHGLLFADRFHILRGISIKIILFKFWEIFQEIFSSWIKSKCEIKQWTHQIIKSKQKQYNDYYKCYHSVFVQSFILPWTLLFNHFLSSDIFLKI